MASNDDVKKAQAELRSMRNNLDALQQVLKNSSNKEAELLIEHMSGENGMLRSLGKMLNQILEDPIVRQAVESTGPIDPRKSN